MMAPWASPNHSSDFLIELELDHNVPIRRELKHSILEDEREFAYDQPKRAMSEHQEI